jgi:hypothetical protein
MPQWNVRHHPEGTTLEEFHKLLELRREALHAAAKEPGSLFPMPVPWRRGWTAHINLRGRDLDGSLCASIVVRRPGGSLPYVRNVRLVASRALPLTSRTGLRES